MMMQKIRSMGAREEEDEERTSDDKGAVHKLADRHETADKEAASACK
jgi:hypothetical protein